MAVTVCTMNVNNLFVRYRFNKGYPGQHFRVGLTPEQDAAGNWGFKAPAGWKSYYDVFTAEECDLIELAITRENTSWPDILCLQEVECMDAIRLFNDRFLGNHYDHALLIDGHDFRLIDVAVLSTLPIRSIRTHMDDLGGNPYMFTRDCLEVNLHVAGAPSETLTVFLLHLKSKFVGRKPNEMTKAQWAVEEGNIRARGDETRKKQAKRTVQIVKERFPGGQFSSEWFMVAGDLNDAANSKPVKPLVHDAGLENVLDRLPQGERWTHYYEAERSVSQMDYMLLSPALSQDTQNVLPAVERRGVDYRAKSTVDGKPLPKEVKLVDDDTYDPTVLYSDYDPPVALELPFRYDRFPGVDEKTGASDHCPVFLPIP